MAIRLKINVDGKTYTSKIFFTKEGIESVDYSISKALRKELNWISFELSDGSKLYLNEAAINRAVFQIYTPWYLRGLTSK